jgi:predicted acylesterase/phospholipase RssA
MLTLHTASRRRSSNARVGLAIAGGGPIGGMYELGALRALDVAIDGLDLTRLHVYVGVSSGAVLAAGLANRMTPTEMCRVFITGDADDARFRPEIFLRPAVQEYLKRAAGLPRILLSWWRDLLLHPGEISLTEAISRFGELVPTGLFDNVEIENFLRDAFTRHGRSNDFRELRRKLFVVAVDLDSGEAVRFGGPEWEDVPISRAVQASSALPGLYPPVEIRGRQFVDGALRRTMHASVALDQEIDLLIGLNPLVPFDASRARTAGHSLPRSLVNGGLPAVLSQTFRTLLQSRMQVGMAKYATQYEHTDQLVFEPNPDDAEMFFTNVFSYSSRQRVCEHAFQATLADLRARREQLGPALQRHGLRLRDEILDDESTSLISSLDPRARRHPDTTARLKRALDDVDALIAKRPRRIRR